MRMIGNAGMAETKQTTSQKVPPGGASYKIVFILTLPNPTKETVRCVSR